MRISDWSSDVCSSDLGLLSDSSVFLGRKRWRYLRHDGPEHVMAFAPTRSGMRPHSRRGETHRHRSIGALRTHQGDRKSTRLNPVTNAHLVCRLLLEKKKLKNETCNKVS